MVFNKQYATLSDGRKLEYVRVGSGDSLIVCEAGLGMGAHYWSLVAQRLPAGVSLLAYNRAGMGESDIDAEFRTLERIAGDLVQLIHSQSYREVVLVGHSWGGPIVRVATALGVSGIRGIVLVDPTDEHLLGFFTEKNVETQQKFYKALSKLKALGLFYRLLLKKLPQPYKSVVLQEVMSRSSFAEALAETAHIRAGLKMLSESAPLPVSGILISGQLPAELEPKQRREAINKAHAKASTTLGLKLVEANKSGHNVPLSEPKLVLQMAVSLFTEKFSV